ncbi:MAG TPA: ATP-grasp domain-containing protein [Actinomycetota bacterium]|nr:ATP-grasp domain-containing protein [Actinomycetota bacterium]
MRRAVVVDPYSSGALIAPELRARRVAPIAVTSTPAPPEVYAATYRPGDFDDVVAGHGRVDDVAAAVARLEPLCVVPGTECGVELADALAARVTPALANDPELAAARRHKGLMGRAVARAGLPHARETCTGDEASVERWLVAEGLEDAALVLKPPNSAGTDAVVKVEPRAPWRPAFRALLGRTNKLGHVNREVVVQEFLAGDEYVVDSFSHHGRHGVTNVCKYRKVANAQHVAVYDSMEFLSPDDPVAAAVAPYAERVLDALGIHFGPAHTEVMWTATGPRLVETGARMHGGGHPRYCRVATGDSQLDRMMRFYVDRAPVADSYRLRRKVVVAFLIARASGVVRNVHLLDAAAGLPSHFESHVGAADGDHVPATRDLFTALGFIVLAHDDPERVWADYAAVKEMESALVFDEPADRRAS